MSQQQIFNFRYLRSLLAQLKEFGLNPADWRICGASPSLEQLLLQHRYDMELKLMGETHLESREHVRWLKISLVSF